MPAINIFPIPDGDRLLLFAVWFYDPSTVSHDDVQSWFAKPKQPPSSLDLTFHALEIVKTGDSKRAERVLENLLFTLQKPASPKDTGAKPYLRLDAVRAYAAQKFGGVSKAEAAKRYYGRQAKGRKAFEKQIEQFGKVLAEHAAYPAGAVWVDSGASISEALDKLNLHIATSFVVPRPK